MFSIHSIHSDTNPVILVTFILSASVMNLAKSNILLFDTELRVTMFS